MANKRMFDKQVVGSDKFIDLPNSSKALYFMAGMEADDKGFFQPRKLQRMCGFSDDDYKILIAKGFFITFESGVMVVTDWNKNNWLDNRRVSETEYVDELNMLKLINRRYELDLETTPAKQLLSEYSIEENRIDKNNINNIYGQMFETFYQEYPKKVKKAEVKKWFIKHKPTEELFNTMMEQLKRFKQTKEWRDIQYIPYPSTWLNQKRWEDQIETEEEKDKKLMEELEEMVRKEETNEY